MIFETMYKNFDDEWEYCRKDIDMTKETIERMLNKNTMHTSSGGVDVIINGNRYNVPEVMFTHNYYEKPKVTICGNVEFAPTIKDVIFNPPATIVFWSDNTKTVVKADEETYDPEKGLAMAISRKMIGDNKREYYNVFRHYLKKWEKQKRQDEPRINFYNDFMVSTSCEADDIIDKMNELVSEYGLLRVSDFYDLVGMISNYTDNKYGWTSIKNVRVIETKNGYLIRMPRAVPIM